MELTIKMHDIVYSIKNPQGEHYHIEEMFEEVLIPLLISAGYHPSVVRDAMRECGSREGEREELSK